MDERFTFVSEKEVIEKIKAQAKSKGMSASSYVRMLVIEAMKKEESK